MTAVEKSISVIDEIISLAKKLDLPLLSVCEVIGNERRTEYLVPGHRVNDIYSITKNFTALAAGILYDEQRLSLSDSVYDILSRDYPQMSLLWKGVSVENVLTQTTGIDRGLLDIDSEDMSIYGNDYLEAVLNAPLPYKGGEHFCYSDSNFYLMSRIVSTVYGMPMQELLQNKVFAPLGFAGHAVACCSRGFAMGGTGLFLNIEQMASFGILCRDLGTYNGQRIVSDEWMRKATSPRVRTAPDTSYGFSFWKPRGLDAFECNGMYNQLIFISPSLGRVIAWQAFDRFKSCQPLKQLLYENEMKLEK